MPLEHTASGPSFELSEEHRMIQHAARDFAQNEIAPIAAEFDERGDFPLETVRKMGEMGFMGIEIPEQYGGSGLDTLSYALALEEISKADAAHGTIMSVNNSLFCYAILRYGTEEQKQKYLKPVASGAAIGAYNQGLPAKTTASFSMDANPGSAVRPMPIRSWSSSQQTRSRGIEGSAPLSPNPIMQGSAGARRNPNWASAPLRQVKSCMMIIFAPWKTCWEKKGRIGIASQALGIAEAAYEASVAYARDREAFGQKIGKFQGVSFKLADMKTRIEASRLLVYQAALAKERAKSTDKRFTQEAAMAKLFASETAMFVTHQAVQIHAGVGYSKEYPVERYFRDAKITEIYEGTSEILRLVISRSELGLR